MLFRSYLFMNLAFFGCIMMLRRYIIDEQNNMELAILMRSIYLQHSKNLNCQFKKQIKELNDIVVDAIIPGLMSNIKQYITYLRDKSSPLQKVIIQLKLL